MKVSGKRLHTLRPEALFVPLSEKGKKRLCLNHVKPLKSLKPEVPL